GYRGNRDGAAAGAGANRDGGGYRGNREGGNREAGNRDGERRFDRNRGGDNRGNHRGERGHARPARNED
ncbi:ATP-dependent RNA helicase, partial [Vibrio renipiscarius]